MPVYDGDLDNIVGIVNTKDLFYLFSLQGRGGAGGRPLPGAVPQAGRDVANALRLFRKAHRPMAAGPRRRRARSSA